jgi:hypothetical protein
MGKYICSCIYSLVLDGGELSASFLGRFTPGERAPVTQWVGDWVGPRNGLGEVKVELFLCFAKRHSVKTYWGWSYSTTHSLTSALEGGEWSASRSGRFTPAKEPPHTHWMGDWVGPSSRLEAVWRRESPYWWGNILNLLTWKQD